MAASSFTSLLASSFVCSLEMLVVRAATFAAYASESVPFPAIRLDTASLPPLLYASCISDVRPAIVYSSLLVSDVSFVDSKAVTVERFDEYVESAFSSIFFVMSL